MIPLLVQHLRHTQTPSHCMPQGRELHEKTSLSCPKAGWFGFSFLVLHLGYPWAAWGHSIVWCTEKLKIQLSSTCGNPLLLCFPSSCLHPLHTSSTYNFFSSHFQNRSRKSRKGKSFHSFPLFFIWQIYYSLINNNLSQRLNKAATYMSYFKQACFQAKK